MAAVAGAEAPLARWARATRRSALQDALSLGAGRPGLISLALGLPAVEAFPREAFLRAEAEVWSRGAGHLQYHPPAAELRRQVAELMAARGVACDEDDVFITAGAQQGLSLLTRLLLDPGGCVAVEDLTYSGLRQAIEPLEPELMEVPTVPGRGIDLDALEEMLRGGRRPAFLYAMPTGHNPLGVSLGHGERVRLVALAREFGVPIVEDDAYGFLQYGDDAVAPLRALAAELVCYVGSFSKILAPTLRVGWIVAPRRLMEGLAILKEATDINTATLSQDAVSAYLAQGDLPRHISVLRELYRERRDALLAAVARDLPSGATVVHPTSGFFAWVELPDGVDTGALFDAALRENVMFLPAGAFRTVASVRRDSGIRLSFSVLRPDEIREGIARLATALERTAPGALQEAGA